ncbi:Hypothetical predicted protein [Paramuricea clavata]|uniref:Uncharacterized protein n=1 Tax=Paramuricea clavata TaxID=317549 RepID=A0A7D9HJQ7_PARCT|nr:Hypothetical predicted protein [Paramuricea clavata]
MAYRTYSFKASFSISEGDVNIKLHRATTLAEQKLKLRYYKYIDYILQLSTKVVGLMQFSQATTPQPIKRVFADCGVLLEIQPIGRKPIVEHIRVWALSRHHGLQKNPAEWGAFSFGGPALESNMRMILQSRIETYISVLEEYLASKDPDAVLRNHQALYGVSELPKLAGFVDALRRLPVDGI